MEETTIAAGEEILAVAAMQNLPAPSGSVDNTQPFDYDRERLFSSVSSLHSALSNRQNNADTFRRLFITLDGLEKKGLGSGTVYVHVRKVEASALPVVRGISSWLSSGLLVHVPVYYQVLQREVSIEALRFCKERGILQFFPIALRLIEKFFSPVNQVSFEIEEDPETEEEWLAINITVSGEVSQILDKYDQYTDSWISAVPWPERVLFRLSYNIL
ncbi:MAG: hypothetical protein MCM46_12205 [Candidatus Manganitrophus sp. SB1]|nr:hypothetical protein [Candidatus Manganitrophus morganii]